ncbi:ABC transporter substrate-binding protein [Clostridium sp. JNZ J1-5]
MFKKGFLKSFFSFLMIMILAISFGGCSPQNKTSGNASEKKESAVYPMKIVDSYNREVTIEKEPQKIVSIAPNITETIFALGKGNKLVGRTDFCDYPAEVKDIQSIGTLKDPNIEKIVELKPDLVIASTHFKKDVLRKLEGLGIKVVVLYGQESFDGVYDTIKKVGQVTNANNEAEKIVTDMKKKVENVVSKVKDKNKPKVYYVVGYGKTGDFTAGKGTFINSMIEMAGGDNVAKDTEGWKYSLEKLIEKNPEIIVCSKSFDTKKGIESTNGYKDLKAVKEGKLIEIDNNLLDRQGPRLALGLEELAKVLHPDIFK